MIRALFTAILAVVSMSASAQALEIRDGFEYFELRYNRVVTTKTIPMMRVRDNYRPDLINHFSAVIDVKTGNLLGMAYKKVIKNEFKEQYSTVEQIMKTVVLSEVEKLGSTYEIVRVTAKDVNVTQSAKIVIDYRKDSIWGKRGSVSFHIARSGGSWAIYKDAEAFKKGDLPLNDLFFRTGDKGIKGVTATHDVDLAKEYAKRGGAIK